MFALCETWPTWAYLLQAMVTGPLTQVGPLVPTDTTVHAVREEGGAVTQTVPILGLLTSLRVLLHYPSTFSLLVQVPVPELL